MHWGRATYGEFVAATWSPTVRDIERAHKAGHTWSYARWQREVKNGGITAIHRVLDQHGFATDPSLRTRRTAPPMQTMQGAADGLLEWAMVEYSARPGWSIEHWLPSKRDIEKASSENKTWTYAMWLDRTGRTGIAGVHRALQRHANIAVASPYRPRALGIATFEQAAEGLRRWGMQYYGSKPGWSVDTWSPTPRDFEKASKARMSWSLSTWIARTGNRNLYGVHEQLNEHGFHIRLRAAMSFDRAARGLRDWLIAQGRDADMPELLRRDVSIAALTGATWSYEQWTKHTGNRGMAGIAEALNTNGYRVRSRVFASSKQAGFGLWAWGMLTYAHDRTWSAGTWRVTKGEIERAAADRRTWSYPTWLKNTNNEGLDGIHRALRAYGIGDRITAANNTDDPSGPNNLGRSLGR